MAGQTWGLPGPASLALTLRTAAVVVLFEGRGEKRGQNGWRDRESSAIALGSKRGKKLVEEDVGLRTGDGHEIFVTSQVGSLSGSGSRCSPGQVQARGVAQLDGTDASSIAVSGNTSAAATNGSSRC